MSDISNQSVCNIETTLRNYIWRIELRDSGVATGNPAQNIDLARVGETAADPVLQHLEQSVGAKILKVIDVGLHSNALFSVDHFGVIGVKGQLHIRLAKLNLLVTICCTMMKHTKPNLTGELALIRRCLDLIIERWVGPRVEPVLRHRIVPDQFLEVVQRCSHR